MNPKDDCFCELAPLYALDIIDDPERHLVEEKIIEYPELAEELAELQEAVAAISYTVPTVPMTTDLKNRLFNKIGISDSSELPISEPIEEISLPYSFVRSQDLDWQLYRLPGVMVATLHTDLVKREVSGLFRAAAGVRYPLHCHAGVEEMFMLEGDLVIGEEVYGQGDYIRSTPGSMHAPETRGGCMFFFRASLDDEYPEN
ncbi:cupin domain-containing protein [Anabaena sp. PCC 7108]|uniref:cupin domain-containing protein n=1 Tax=Anabaena sp. PCC 7108 TaxID=163908 RepID=UPI00034B10A3|nr:cupin domain-containing protein [Anabaena sp. PCC 7108]